MTSPTILIAAGASGGHLFPALAVAEELRHRGMTCVFVVGGHKFIDQVNQAGFAMEALPASAFNVRNPLRRLKAVGMLAVAWWRAMRLMQKYAPTAVFGTGGYATVATVLAAKASGVPVVLHEQNVQPGRATKFLARWADTVAVAFPNSGESLPCSRELVYEVGNPIRQHILKTLALPRQEEEGVFRLLIMGGSQGAQVLSDVVPETVALLTPEVLAKLEILHQARPEDIVRVQAGYAALPPLRRVRVVPFIEEVGEALAQAHGVIARAGTGTVVETSLAGRAAIYVPLPLADGHQLKNAQVAEEAGAAVILEQGMFSPETLLPHLQALLQDGERRQDMERAARTLFKQDATKEVANLIVKTARDDVMGAGA
jgi:UDP-N-acetylglucosamine--N-acetylmuramyl-(pentapeptide) pyrophosphoryl-undecaprenol N-acetylglucosamine transferase